jgi:hypothetical protein
VKSFLNVSDVKRFLAHYEIMITTHPGKKPSIAYMPTPQGELQVKDHSVALAFSCEAFDFSSNFIMSDFLNRQIRPKR